MSEKIGERLIQLGIMSPEQVAEVLRVQQEDGFRLFGEIAIELGYIDDEALKRYLDSR